MPKVVMTSREIRKANLLRLLANFEATGANHREFAAACGLSPNGLSQHLTQGRIIGDTIARRIESTLGLEVGHLDVLHDSDDAPKGGNSRPLTDKQIAMVERAVATMLRELGDTALPEIEKARHVAHLVRLLDADANPSAEEAAPILTRVRKTK